MEATFITLEEELKKHPEVKKEELEPFKDWLARQPHLPPVKDSELFLFWHSCHFRLEPAKAALDTYFTVRTLAPELFVDRALDSKDVKLAFQSADMCILPGKTLDGSAVSVSRYINPDPSVYHFASVLKTWIALADIWQAREGSADGFFLIIDMSNVGVGHMARLSLPIMSKFFVYLQEGMPVRLKAIHFVNIPSIMDQIMGIMKPFLKKELLGMMHLHKNCSDLPKYISKKDLPQEMGGDVPWKQFSDKTRVELKAYTGYLKDLESRLVVEAKRPGKAKTAGDIFGVEGSFKKLDLD